MIQRNEFEIFWVWRTNGMYVSDVCACARIWTEKDATERKGQNRASHTCWIDNNNNNNNKSDGNRLRWSFVDKMHFRIMYLFGRSAVATRACIFHPSISCDKLQCIAMHVIWIFFCHLRAAWILGIIILKTEKRMRRIVKWCFVYNSQFYCAVRMET